MERQTVLDSLSTLSEEDQNELLQRLEAYPEKDRLKMARQFLQDWGKEKRKRNLDKAQEDAAQKRKENDSLQEKK